jgi:hypothetical protein
VTETYNPAQQKVIDMLGKAEVRPDIPPSLADEIRADLQKIGWIPSAWPED